jgi:hypothetical protein
MSAYLTAPADSAMSSISLYPQARLAITSEF